MRHAFALAVLLAASCHGRDPEGWPIDGPPPDRFVLCDGGLALFCTPPPPPPPDCSPVLPPGMQGCAAGEKCTWAVLSDAPELIGHIGCVPDGTLGLGETCTPAAVGAPDACAAGLICIEDECRDVCDWSGSAAGRCATGMNCTRFDGVFANGKDDPIAGACLPGCDPVAQLTHEGEPCPAGEGCYLLTSQIETIAVCANAGTIPHGAMITGPAFANSCVPGAQPRRRDGASMVVECGGLCRPADVTSTTNMESEAGVAPDSCTTRWGAAPPDDPVEGESCRYWWAREPFEGLSPYSNTVGWCFKHPAFQYDTNGDMTLDAPFPRCTSLAPGEAQFFWCTAMPAMSKPAMPVTMRVDRLRL